MMAKITMDKETIITNLRKEIAKRQPDYERGWLVRRMPELGPIISLLWDADVKTWYIHIEMSQELWDSNMPEAALREALGEEQES